MAIEKFENRNLNGKINIALEGRGNWAADKRDIIDKMISIVESYERQGYTLTLRQLYYQLVAADYIPNHDKVYKKVSSLLDDCRYSGEIDWDAIEDRGRVPYQSYYEHSVSDALTRTINSYRLDGQKGQPIHIEVWTEKDAISGILKKVVQDYTVRLVVNKGYISSAAIYNAYIRFCGAMDQGQKVCILYFGDHDPSGLDMIRDIRERLTFMFNNGHSLGWRLPEELDMDTEEFVDTHFEVVPIGLTMTQIKALNPPHNPAKMTDPRAAWYVKQYGQKSWEVDAIKPQIMSKIVREAIISRMDARIQADVIAQEESDIKKLSSFINDGNENK